MMAGRQGAPWIWADLGGWNLYFLSKLALAWTGALNVRVVPNLFLLAALLVPLRWRWARVLRTLAAVPLGIALYYQDTWWPPFSSLLDQPAVLHFSAPYYWELAQRFVSLEVVAVLGGLLLGWWLLRHWVRMTTLSVIGMLVLGVLALPAPAFLPTRTLAAAPSAAGADGETNAPLTAATVGQWLAGFYQQQATLQTRFPPAAAQAAPFDVIVLNICSLAWDDLDVVGMRHNVLYDHLDLVFDDFNSATSYSGPAAIRLLRASCGQPPHAALYAPAAAGCYLFENLRKLGFQSELAMNHDGHFDDFLGELSSDGNLDAKPLNIANLRPAMLAFDDSPVRRDGDVLASWLKRRDAEGAKQVALFYNTISLHDGNRVIGADGRAGESSYKPRVQMVLGDIAGFITALRQEGRRAVVVVVPEHGANLRGDRMQIPGMRQIPTPAITHVPVGVAFVNMGFPPEAGPQHIAAPSSFLALSELISRLYALNAQGPAAGAAGWAALTRGLPTTPSVSANEGVEVVDRDGQVWLKLHGSAWAPYPGGR